MANDYFRFRRFTIWQDKCAMKVGTDGTLLGAWASGGCRVLDVGTGTGLVALMMAQRFAGAAVVGVDVDAGAVAQARQNVALSPFAGRIEIMQCDIRCFDAPQPFDAIVSNPPYFDRSLECPEARRTMARHTSALTYSELMAAAVRLLADRGRLSVVIPSECRARLEGEAALAGLFKTAECAVKTTPRKPARRFLLSFARHPAVQVSMEEGVIQLSPGERSPWYQQLTEDFYL